MSETNNDKEKLGFFKLLKQLSNLTDKDFDNIKGISSGNFYQENNKDPESRSYLDLIDKAFNRSYTYGDNSPQTRKQLYKIYDEMDQEVSYVSAALDILSDDATQSDEDGNTIIITSDSDKVFSLTKDFFDNFGIEEKLSKWARVVAKYGDYFIKVSAEHGKGITKINDTIYPSNVERLDFDGELVAFSDSIKLDFNKLSPPWEYVHFRHKGDITSSSQNDDNNMIASEEEIHNLSSSYGQSVLRPAIKVYAQLRFVENMILLSRLTNSIRRNIFMINVGDVAPDKSFETVKSYADLLKKNVSLDLEQGIYNSQKKTISYDEDIFIPVSDPKNDVRIEQVGGDANIAEQYDLEYLLNKLFSALKIPKAYLNYEQDLNARSTLIQLDIRYARSVASLQKTLRSGLLRLANINLAFHGLDPETVNLDIQLVPVSTIDEDTKRQETLSKIEVANSIWSTISSINDKISNKESSVNSAIPGLGNSMLENSNSNNNDSLDMKYAAELILTDYVGLSSEEINKLFKRNEETKELEPNIKSNSARVTFRKVSQPVDKDVRSLYPTSEGMKTYKSLTETLILRNQKTNTNN